MLDPVASPATPSDTTVSTADLYRIFRSYVEHENGLINQRLGSGLLINGFLFSVYGGVLTKVVGAGPLRRRSLEAGLLERTLAYAEHHPNVLISIGGMLLAVVSFLSILAAVRAIECLAEQWSGLVKKGGLDPRLPSLTAAGDRSAEWLGFKMTLALPGLILAIWISLLVYSLTLPGDDPAPQSPRAAPRFVHPLRRPSDDGELPSASARAT